MEHSTLHAIQLIGLLLTLGGPLLVLGVLRPSDRALRPDAEREVYARALEKSVARWTFYGALGAGLGTLADLFVQTAELQGKTVFNGVDLSLVVRFATQTSVGQLSLLRAGALLITAGRARLTGRGQWWTLLVLAAASVTLTSLVSHAAAQPTGRMGAVATQIAHLCGGAAWLGGLTHLLAARQQIQAASEPACARLTAEMVRRFSPVAMAAAALLGLSGLLAAARFVGEPEALVTSAYGLTLLLKLLLLGLVCYAGFQNYGTIRPALLVEARRGSAGEAAPARRQELLRRFSRALELEVTAGLLVITIAGILGSVSPPGQAGRQRLTEAQAQALLRPHLPVTRIVSPKQFYGTPERTLNDMRYAEFMHNWSGIAVCLLGVCWLLQSVGNRLEAWAARLWPGMLVVFGLFIGLASDPELWLLHRVSPWRAAGDPQLLEHQMGAGMVFLLAWMAWRNRRQARRRSLLGYALPGIMVFGSLLLLGHAHSTLNAAEPLTNLINVQHAIFGTFGLLAGTVRWLSLRALIPPRAAAWVWPSLVIGLGLFMAFCYREVA